MPKNSQPIRPEESVAKMIGALKEKTGKTIEEWRGLILQNKWAGHKQIVGGLKGEHGISHGYANQIALHILKGDQPAEDPIDEMFAKRPEAKAIYDHLLPKIQAFGADVDLAPKKGYVALRRSKQFAILQPAAGRLDVGLQLKGVSPAGRLEASGSFNSMLSHRVKVSTIEQVDGELLEWLKDAYDAS